MTSGPLVKLVAAVGSASGHLAGPFGMGFKRSMTAASNSTIGFEMASALPAAL
jgi:hypothetical protein